MSDVFLYMIVFGAVTLVGAVALLIFV